MRELVYLSERKLGEFRQERRRGFRVREIGVPGVGQVGIEQPGDSHLDDVIDHLGSIARWYQEDGLAPGEWVQFEASMSYIVLEIEGMGPILLFAEAPGDRRLVLHGSPEHLIGAPPQPVATLPWLNMSRGPALRRLLAAIAKQSGPRPRIGHLLDHVEDPFDPELAAPMTGFARLTSVGRSGGGVVASPLFVAYARQ
jgi:hypothetical protein